LRIPIIVGNWKMNLLQDSSLELVRQLVERIPSNLEADFAVCPPSVYLAQVQAELRGSHIGLGAQNMHHELSGAYTGELSGSMLKDVGCQYVLLGHSERRQFFGETDASIHKKILTALSLSLTPIVCVGESLTERESGSTGEVVETQVRGCLEQLNADQAGQLVVAYEPVWAIGTGKTATPAQAEEVHAHIRSLLVQLFGSAVGDSIRIQYGGSVKADNAQELLSQPNIDGALVGGASLQADSFAAICSAANAKG
jgi:triosephosphate isomerase (TIM)